MHPKIKYIEDPNAVNLRNQHGENTITNAVANYQDMNIFAELTASRRGRSVIVTGEGMQKTGTEKTLKVNFIGNNQNKNNYGDDNDINNPNYLNFTTNYYDGSTPVIFNSLILEACRFLIKKIHHIEYCLTFHHQFLI